MLHFLMGSFADVMNRYALDCRRARVSKLWPSDSKPRMAPPWAVGKKKDFLGRAGWYIVYNYIYLYLSLSLSLSDHLLIHSFVY